MCVYMGIARSIDTWWILRPVDEWEGREMDVSYVEVREEDGRGRTEEEIDQEVEVEVEVELRRETVYCAAETCNRAIQLCFSVSRSS